jgi:Uma2 family endonuclease
MSAVSGESVPRSATCWRAIRIRCVRRTFRSCGRTGSLPTVRLRVFFRGAPDLAIEVVSPNDRYNEVRTKVREYLAAGTAMVLVVDPEDRTVSVYRPERAPLELAEADAIDGEDVVPGWTLPVRDIFA